MTKEIHVSVSVPDNCEADDHQAITEYAQAGVDEYISKLAFKERCIRLFGHYPLTRDELRFLSVYDSFSFDEMKRDEIQL